MTNRPMQFNRMELAGSLGDLGTLLPLTIGMIMINGLSAVGTLFTIGLYYILAGYYFRIPVSVQPMKLIGAYAIATEMTVQQVCSSTLLMALLLAVIGLTGAISRIGSLMPKEVIRGVQLSTGLLLMSQGIRFILGSSSYQESQGFNEPFLFLQNLGPLPIGIVIATIGFILSFYLLNSKRFPAALAIIGFGILTSLFFGDTSALRNINIGFYLPEFLPFGLPAKPDFTIALFVLVLPQIPMTMGNAVIASRELARDYFHEAAERTTYTSLTLSMALAAGASFLFGGIPLCHGAGGLAAHYRFGARTAGSNLMIGTVFLFLAIFFGSEAITLLHLLPMSILGVLLVFAGAQLGLTILDVMNKRQILVVISMLAITLTTNLAWAFLVGICLSYALKSEKISI